MCPFLAARIVLHCAYLVALVLLSLRFRAGIEGRISVLIRRFELDRCCDHGEAGLGRWVGWGIVTANLLTIAHNCPIQSIFASHCAPETRTRRQRLRRE